MFVLTQTLIPGIARTKGSLTFRGGKRVEESVQGSTQWRRLVAQAVRMDITKRWGSDWEPTTGPVGVRMHFWLPTSTEGVSGKGPIKSGSGDVDKLVRNVLDALTDAKLYRDDVQVVRIVADKMTVEPGTIIEHPCLVLMVWEMDSTEIHYDRIAARGLAAGLL